MRHIPVRPQPCAQRGFVQAAILFGLVVLMVVMAAFAIVSNSSQATAGQEEARVNSGVVIKQAADIKSALGRFISDGLNPLTVTLDSNTTTGLYDPTRGFGSVPLPPVKSFESSAYIWALNTHATVGGRASTIVVLPGIKKDVAMRVNNILYNDPVAQPADAPTVAADIPSLIGGTPVFSTSSRIEGAFKTSDGAYVYVNLAQIR